MLAAQLLYPLLGVRMRSAAPERAVGCRDRRLLLLGVRLLIGLLLKPQLLRGRADLALDVGLARLVLGLHVRLAGLVLLLDEAHALHGQPDQGPRQRDDLAEDPVDALADQFLTLGEELLDL